MGFRSSSRCTSLARVLPLVLALGWCGEVAAQLSAEEAACRAAIGKGARHLAATLLTLQER